MESAVEGRRFNRKLLIVCAMRLVDSMSIHLVTPYGLELVSKFLDEPRDSPAVGTAYAWLIGLFYLFEILCSPLWGWLADSIGRRPCLLIGIAGTAITPVLLSLGQSLSIVLLFRAIDGFFCGNQSLLRTYLGELVEQTREKTEKANEGRAFGFLVLCFVLGLIAGPFLGGLAFPAHWAPEVFEGSFLEDYPVLLPNLIFAVLAAACGILGFCCLEETLRAKQLDLESETSSVDGTSVDGTSIGTTRESRCHCYSRPVLQNLLAFCGLAYAVEAQVQLSILLWQYPKSTGGFDFSPQEVSMVLVAGGAGPILCHLTFFQQLTKKLGLLNVLVLGFLVNTVSYGLYPLYALLIDDGDWRCLVLGLVEFVGMSGTFLMYSTIFIFMNRASAGLNRATVNAWGNSGRALCRAIAPFYATKLLDASETWGPVGRYGPFYITSAILALCFAFSWTGLSQMEQK